MKINNIIIIALISVSSMLTSCSADQIPVHPTHYEVVTSYVPPVEHEEMSVKDHQSKYIPFDFDGLPDYSGDAVHIVNFNMPYFMSDEITDEPFETYSPLDDLGRCGPAAACLSIDMIPGSFTERPETKNIRPSGWHVAMYPDLISNDYLYNRCNLIGWSLSDKSAKPENLITGTKYMNVSGLLPYERIVSDYILSTGNHVMYRATPVFIDNELICRGVLLEAQSVEDNGCVFCVFCYNVQPAIKIDYLTGDSDIDRTYAGMIPDKTGAAVLTYVINTHTQEIHRSHCPHINDIEAHYKSLYTGDVSQLFDRGYIPCESCNP